LYIILIVGAAFVFLQYMPVGEVRYVGAAVASFGGKLGAAGGAEYLVMKTETGKTVSVGFIDRLSIDDEFTLSV